jgi:hypothetical protein
MPSGLTFKIYSGEELTLRDFALRCVRQLGAGYFASQQGEKELPKDKAPILKVDNYHEIKILKAEKELEKWENLRNNLEEAQKLYDEQYAQNMQYNTAVNEERKEIKKRYNTVLEKVKAWDIPIEYNSLKELMLKQLTESIKWDCAPYTPYKEEKVPIEEWIEVRIRLAKRDLDYHTKEFQEEKRRIAEYNNYLKGLYDALDKVEPLT